MDNHNNSKMLLGKTFSGGTNQFILRGELTGFQQKNLIITKCLFHFSTALSRAITTTNFYI